MKKSFVISLVVFFMIGELAASMISHYWLLNLTTGLLAILTMILANHLSNPHAIGRGGRISRLVAAPLEAGMLSTVISLSMATYYYRNSYNWVLAAFIVMVAWYAGYGIGYYQERKEFALRRRSLA